MVAFAGSTSVSVLSAALRRLAEPLAVSTLVAVAFMALIAKGSVQQMGNTENPLTPTLCADLGGCRLDELYLPGAMMIRERGREFQGAPLGKLVRAAGQFDAGRSMIVSPNFIIYGLSSTRLWTEAGNKQTRGPAGLLAGRRGEHRMRCFRVLVVVGGMDKIRTREKKK